MSNLLHLDSSADVDGSVSQTTARFADAWARRGHQVVRRDLLVHQPPHLPTNVLHWAPRLRLPGESVRPEDERYQQELCAELLEADVVLIGAPMYNWSVPSTLKAWIDWVHVPGLTAAGGPDEAPPLSGRPIVIVSARGLAYGPGTGMDDHELAALRQLFVASMQMELYPVLAELTLAGRVPDLESQSAAGTTSRVAAEAEIDRLVALLA